MFGFSKSVLQGHDIRECSRSSNSKSGDISPPPYSKQDVKEETKAALPQAYPRHGLCVPICHHETMSFERYQRILNLEHFSSGFTIEAISGVPTGYHSITTTGAKSIQICRPASNGFESSGRANILEGKGHIKGFFGYLELKMQWTIDDTYHQHLFDSYKSAQYLLDPYRVSLCPHRTLSDPEIAKKVLSLLDPTTRTPDPIDRHEEHHRLKTCKDCRAGFEFSIDGMLCTVKVRRELRKAKSPKDLLWTSHCSKVESI